MNIFSRLFRSSKNSFKNEDVNSVEGVADLSNLELANLPKDKRLKNFYGMKSFAHYIGSGGENLVKTELLLRGINVAKPVVDDGVDLVAFGKGGDRGNNFSVNFIQVKTSFLDSERNRYSFNLSSIQNGDRISYVFILVREASVYNFLIMSAEDIRKEIKKGSIYLNKITKRYRVNVYFRDGKLSLGTVKNEVPSLLNNWELFGVRQNVNDSSDSLELIRKERRVKV